MHPNKLVTAAAAFLSIAGGCIAGADVVDPRLELGKETYAACGACHLPGGEGVAGAFPPLRNRMAGIASTDAGRVYVASVVLDGLTGQINVNGSPYFGFMQANRQTLSDEQISAVLNYVIFELADRPPDDVRVFSPEEIAAVRAEPGSAQNSATLRQSLELE